MNVYLSGLREQPLQFEWDEAKNRENLRRHDVRFETAQLVFDDPFAVTLRADSDEAEEERWVTIGSDWRPVISVLHVVHIRGAATETLRMISARKSNASGKGRLMRKLTKEQKRDVAVSAAKKDEDIDLTDMPERLDWSGAVVGMFYRPAKRPVTMRLDEDVVAWLKGFGRGYQTKANLLLRHAMMSSGERKPTRSR